MADNKQITELYSTAETTQGATFKASKISSTLLREKHWDTVFKNSDYTEVLWHQHSPKKSLELINKYSNNKTNIIDVGCGASLLVDNLLKEGYENITLLDTSKTSLEIVKDRVHNQNIKFICDDILNFKTDKRFNVWHDRAVFHFLLTKKERQRYFEVLLQSLGNDSIAIISTFRIDGPIQCAGLDIVQYDTNKIKKELPSELELIESQEFTHLTPKNSEQEYIYFVIKISERIM